MRKILFTAALLLSITGHADSIGFSIGAYNWQTDVSGGITADTAVGPLDISIDRFDLDTQSNTVWFATLEHPIPALPNIKFAYSDLISTGYNGVIDIPNAANTTVQEGVLDVSHYDLTAYYEVLDNIISLDIGLTARFFDGELSLYGIAGTSIGTSTPIETELPLLYTRAAMALPFGFNLEAEANMGKWQDQTGFDFSGQVQYRSPIGLGAALGYRIFEAEITPNADQFYKNPKYDIAYKGPMFYIFYSF